MVFLPFFFEVDLELLLLAGGGADTASEKRIEDRDGEASIEGSERTTWPGGRAGNSSSGPR